MMLFDPYPRAKGSQVRSDRRGCDLLRLPVLALHRFHDFFALAIKPGKMMAAGAVLFENFRALDERIVGQHRHRAFHGDHAAGILGDFHHPLGIDVGLFDRGLMVRIIQVLIIRQAR